MESFDPEYFINRMEALGFPEDMIHDLKVSNELAQMTGSRLLTNTFSKDRDYILQAVAITGFNIYIEEEVYYNTRYVKDCRLIKGMIAIYTRDIDKDHTPFWKVFDELKYGGIKK